MFNGQNCKKYSTRDVFLLLQTTLQKLKKRLKKSSAQLHLRFSLKIETIALFLLCTLKYSFMTVWYISLLSIFIRLINFLSDLLAFLWFRKSLTHRGISNEPFDVNYILSLYEQLRMPSKSSKHLSPVCSGKHLNTSFDKFAVFADGSEQKPNSENSRLQSSTFSRNELLQNYFRRVICEF